MPITCRFEPILFQRDSMLTITVEYMVTMKEWQFDQLLRNCGYEPKVEDEDGIVKTKTYKMRYSDLLKAFAALPDDERFEFKSVDEIFSYPGAVFDGKGDEVDNQ